MRCAAGSACPRAARSHASAFRPPAGGAPPAPRPPPPGRRGRGARRRGRSGAPGRFGAHQFREKLDSTLVYVTWFAGGLRIVDVADPYNPKQVAHFIPEPVAGEPSPQSNDVEVDGQGLIYLLDRNVGFDILEYTG